MIITSSSNGASELIEPGANGDVVDDATDTLELTALLNKWLDMVPAQFEVDLEALSLERNIEETIRVLELAAKERKEANG